MDEPIYWPWHGLHSNIAIRLTGQSRWQLARDRMEHRGLPHFTLDTFHGNKIYYVASAVLFPDIPLWVACRDVLSRVSLSEPDAALEQVWTTLSYWQTNGPSLFPASNLTTHPRDPVSLLRQIEPLFFHSAHNS